MNLRVSEGLGPVELLKVLVAVPDPRTAGMIARGLHTVDYVPVLAFTADQVIRCLSAECFRLLVIGLDPEPLRLDQAGASPPDEDTAMLVLGEDASASSGSTGHIRYLAINSTVEEIVACSVFLISRHCPARTPLQWGGLQLDVEKRVATIHGAPLSLTVTEFRIMQVLVSAAGSVVTVSELVRRVWGCQLFDDNDRVLAHIRRIRRKIQHAGSPPNLLLTVRGEGFRLADSWSEPLRQEAQVALVRQT